MKIKSSLATKKPKKKKWTSDDTELTLLAIPTVIWYSLFCFLPMFGVLLAFKKYKVTPRSSFLYSVYKSQWVGFENFKFLFKSNYIKILLRNTIVYNIFFIILGIIVPVALAIMINELYSKLKSKIYQTMMFFPFFMSWVVVSYFVYAFLSEDKGMLNQILSYIGISKIKWYSSPEYWPFILVGVNLWKTVGYSMIIYLASIAGIDKSLYEAAVIDGASKWEQVKYITLPSLKNIIIILFILNVGRIFYTDFGLFYQVTRGVPGSLFNVASTLDTYVYNALRGGAPIGMISAVTLFQSAACCISILTTNYIIKKIDNENAII